MRIRKLLTCLILISELLLFCTGICYATENILFATEDVLQESSALYSELANFLRKWADAVLKKDISRLASFSPTSLTEIVLRELKDTSSVIYGMYYGNQTVRESGFVPYYNLLRSIKRLKFVFIKSKGEATYVALFHDADAKIDFPLKEDEVIKLIKDGYVGFVPIKKYEKENRWAVLLNVH